MNKGPIPSADSAGVPPRIFNRYFGANAEYRQSVWTVLCQDFFQAFVGRDATVLDLGCGYGHFINNIRCRKKFAMDLNAEGGSHLNTDVTYICQDCTQRWAIDADSIDVIFTSNFLEHLDDKHALKRTMEEARRCLKPGGRLIAMGPNITCLPGRYWDFSDHSLPLTEISLTEVLNAKGFDVRKAVPRFLPYNMVRTRPHPMLLLRLYLKLPLLWHFFGKQFFVIAEKGTA